MSDLSSLKVVELRQLAQDRGFKGVSRLTKAQLTDMLQNGDDVSVVKYPPEFTRLKCNDNKFLQVQPIGLPGKEGLVYIVIDPLTRTKYAMKKFRKQKSPNTLEREAYYQYLASQHHISPKVIEYNLEDKYIVMELLDRTLLDLIKDTGGPTPDQQRQILNALAKLDEIGIFIRDGNPLNFMEKNGQLYIIDYGLACPTSNVMYKKHYPNVNMRIIPLALLRELNRIQVPTKTWTVLRNSIHPTTTLAFKVDSFI